MHQKQKMTVFLATGLCLFLNLQDTLWQLEVVFALRMFNLHMKYSLLGEVITMVFIRGTDLKVIKPVLLQ